MFYLGSGSDDNTNAGRTQPLAIPNTLFVSNDASWSRTLHQKPHAKSSVDWLISVTS